MKVLVTGHRGFIGTAMVPVLLREGFDVVGLDTDLYRNCTFGSEPQPVPTIQKDVRDVTKDDVRGFEAIVHLAALSNDPLANLNPDLTYEINHVASVRLAEIAKDVGVARFLFASSCSMYGSAGEAILDETADFQPGDALCGVQGACRARRQAAGKRSIQPRVPAYTRPPTAYRRGFVSIWC